MASNTLIMAERTPRESEMDSSIPDCLWFRIARTITSQAPTGAKADKSDNMSEAAYRPLAVHG